MKLIKIEENIPWDHQAKRPHEKGERIPKN